MYLLKNLYGPHRVSVSSSGLPNRLHHILPKSARARCSTSDGENSLSFLSGCGCGRTEGHKEYTDGVALLPHSQPQLCAAVLVKCPIKARHASTVALPMRGLIGVNLQLQLAIGHDAIGCLLSSPASHPREQIADRTLPIAEFMFSRSAWRSSAAFSDVGNRALDRGTEGMFQRSKCSRALQFGKAPQGPLQGSILRADG